jgi:hypothetical protein
MAQVAILITTNASQAAAIVSHTETIQTLVTQMLAPRAG